MDVLMSARKSWMERIKMNIKENHGSERKARHHREDNGMATSKGCQRRDYQNYGMETTGEKEKRMSKKNVDRSISSHDKKFGTRSMEKKRGMAFGFRKTATAVIKPDR
jgi:hypothetical protein